MGNCWTGTGGSRMADENTIQECRSTTQTQTGGGASRNRREEGEGKENRATADAVRLKVVVTRAEASRLLGAVLGGRSSSSAEKVLEQLAARNKTESLRELCGGSSGLSSRCNDRTTARRRRKGSPGAVWAPELRSIPEAEVDVTNGTRIDLQ